MREADDLCTGARPLRRTIQREIEDNLSERILFNELRPGQIILIDCEGDPTDIDHAKLVFHGAEQNPAIPLGVPAGLNADDATG